MKNQLFSLSFQIKFREKILGNKGEVEILNEIRKYSFFQVYQFKTSIFGIVCLNLLGLK